MKWSKTMKVLITAGGTREPIDRVRSITNTSTGATGVALAAALAKLGHEIELLRSANAVIPPADLLKDVPPASGTPEIGGYAPFTTTADLEARLRKRLARGDIDVVIMAAAVADFRPAEPVFRKINSDTEELTLRLIRVPKLLPQLRAMSPRPLRVIGFKLTVDASDAERLAAVAAQSQSSAVDAVVHNDLSEIETAATRGTPHPFRLYARPKNEPATPPPLLLGPDALAAAIHAFLTQTTK